MVAKLFHAPTDDQNEALGVSTVGSSEAIILSVLAAKKRWQNQRKAAGKVLYSISFISIVHIDECPSMSRITIIPSNLSFPSCSLVNLIFSKKKSRYELCCAGLLGKSSQIS